MTLPILPPFNTPRKGRLHKCRGSENKKLPGKGRNWKSRLSAPSCFGKLIQVFKAFISPRRNHGLPISRNAPQQILNKFQTPQETLLWPHQPSFRILGVLASWTIHERVHHSLAERQSIASMTSSGISTLGDLFRFSRAIFISILVNVVIVCIHCEVDVTRAGQT